MSEWAMEWGSYVLAAIGITGLLIAGRKNYWGWLVNLGAQVLWIAFAVLTGQHGFLATAFAYGAVYWINFRNWRKEHTDGKRASAEGV